MKILILFACLILNCEAIGDLNQKYAVVDIDRVLIESSSYKNFKGSWDKENAKYKQEIEFYEMEISRIANQLAKNNSSLTANEVNNLKYRIGQYEIKTQKLVQDRKINMDKKFGDVFGALKNRVVELINRYAIKNGIDLVIPKSQTIYANQGIDITSFIIKDLDQNK